jgi:leishmanolysin-like peptidase
MTGSHTQNRVFSRLTLALMEDTGWYHADYSHAQRLDWGRGLGCDFVMKSCKFWMDKQKQRSGVTSTQQDLLFPVLRLLYQGILNILICEL